MKRARLRYLTLFAGFISLANVVESSETETEVMNSRDKSRTTDMTQTQKQAKLFYRGDMDDAIVKVDNGAHVNHDYAAFVEQGPWSKVTTVQVTPRIHTIVGYGMSNYTFIEADTGLIMVDSGQNIGSGLEVLKMKQAFSDKPVVAIIYTHFHYTRGTEAVFQSYPDLEIPVYGHPDLQSNIDGIFSYLAPGMLRRGAMQFGYHLPKEGADAEYGITEPVFDDPALNAPGHVPVTNPVSDGEKITIDGLEVVFHHAIADTEDSLIIHFPALNAVAHNTAVMPFMFPMYTLRGDYDRSMPDVLESIDKLRSLDPEHLLGCHGVPISGHENVQGFITAHRDALAYVYQQTVRGINQGLSPDEIVHQVRLPQQLAEIPELFPAYVDVEYMVRGVYRGLIGWWANDAADLHPPQADELGAEIVRGFGGIEVLLERVEIVLSEKHYNLAAKLAAYAIASDPDNQSAKNLKATALRKMAYTTPTGIQTRNFLLHETLMLEGKIDPPSSRAKGIVPLSVEMVTNMPPELFLETLLYSIDGQRASDLIATVAITLTDIEQTYMLAVRHGATEFVKSEAASPDLELAFDRKAWAELFLGHKTLKELVDEKRATFTGDDQLKAAFLYAYHEAL